MSTTAPRPLVAYHPRPAELQRLDTVCRYAAQTRAGFVRLAVAFLDSALVLDELARLAAHDGGLTEEQEQVRAEATQTMADVLATLQPQPLVPMSAN